MTTRWRTYSALVCDASPFTRRLISDVLVNAGFGKVHIAKEGKELLQATRDVLPRLVVTSSRIPGLSGLDYTRRVRAGIPMVSRSLPIIVMTDTPTKAFLEAASKAGANEMLARPFTTQSILQRVEAVMDRPREFIMAQEYIGPCRRRRALDGFHGPLRRLTDPLESELQQPWATAENRAIARKEVEALADASRKLTPGDRGQLRTLHQAGRSIESFALSVMDKNMGSAAGSLNRYVVAVGATGVIDGEVVDMHVNALKQLTHLDSQQDGLRQQVVEGLHALVAKRVSFKRTVDQPPRRSAAAGAK